MSETIQRTPPAWREAEDAMGRLRHRSVEAVSQPAEEHSADWFERQTHALRDGLGGTQVGAKKAVEPRNEKPVRTHRAAGVFMDHARVIDSDTLEAGGVRVF